MGILQIFSGQCFIWIGFYALMIAPGRDHKAHILGKAQNLSLLCPGISELFTSVSGFFRAGQKSTYSYTPWIFCLFGPSRFSFCSFLKKIVDLKNLNIFSKRSVSSGQLDYKFRTDVKPRLY
jgi:hypothetical protein